MDSQREVTNKGGIDAPRYLHRPAREESKVAGPAAPRSCRSHRHRYEFNPAYRRRFEGSGFRCSGTSPDGRLVEFIELDDHPYWVATQAHPEFKSRPCRPAPLFRDLVGAARARAEGRNPQLIEIAGEGGARPAARGLDGVDGASGTSVGRRHEGSGSRAEG